MSKTTNTLPAGDQQLMIYYLLPSRTRRLCRALKLISLQQERVDHSYWRQREAIVEKYGPLAQLDDWSADECDGADDDDAESSNSIVASEGAAMDEGDEEPAGAKPLVVLAEKADQLKRLVEEESAEELMACAAAAKSFMRRCESKCHEILTQLANMDYEMRAQASLTRGLYQREMENSITSYHGQLSALYMQRMAIIRGCYEPSDLECQLPGWLWAQQRPQALASESALKRQWEPARDSPQNCYLMSQLRGVPYFWPTAMAVALARRRIIQPDDKGPLSYLSDIRFYFDTDDRHTPIPCCQPAARAHRTQLLLFFFDKNPYFDNRVLSKTLYLAAPASKMSQPPPVVDEKFDGLRVLKTEGCVINWLASEGRPAPLQGPKSRSFFDFFSSSGLQAPELPRGRAKDAATYKKDGKRKDTDDFDYQIFACIRDFLVPHAVIAYTRGHLYGFATRDNDPRRPLDWPHQKLNRRLGYLNKMCLVRPQRQTPTGAHNKLS